MYLPFHLFCCRERRYLPVLLKSPQITMLERWELGLNGGHSSWGIIYQCPLICCHGGCYTQLSYQTMFPWRRLYLRYFILHAVCTSLSSTRVRLFTINSLLFSCRTFHAGCWLLLCILFTVILYMIGFKGLIADVLHCKNGSTLLCKVALSVIILATTATHPAVCI